MSAPRTRIGPLTRWTQRPAGRTGDGSVSALSETVACPVVRTDSPGMPQTVGCGIEIFGTGANRRDCLHARPSASHLLAWLAATQTGGASDKEDVLRWPALFAFFCSLLLCQ